NHAAPVQCQLRFGTDEPGAQSNGPSGDWNTEGCSYPFSQCPHKIGIGYRVRAAGMYHPGNMSVLDKPVDELDKITLKYPRNILIATTNGSSQTQFGQFNQRTKHTAF